MVSSVTTLRKLYHLSDVVTLLTWLLTCAESDSARNDSCYAISFYIAAGSKTMPPLFCPKEIIPFAMESTLSAERFPVNI